MPIETMIANARVARNKECCPTRFQLAPLPTFVVLIVDTRDNGVLRLDNRFDPLSNCVRLKKEKEEEEEERENGEKRRGKQGMSMLRVLFPFIDRYRSYKWAANRNAIFAVLKKGRGGGEGIIANREKYEFAPGLLFSRRT